MAAYVKLNDHEAEQDRSSSRDRSSEADSFLEKQAFRSSQKPVFRRSGILGGFILLFIFNLMCFLLLWNKLGRQSENDKRLVYSPAQDTIRYISKKWDHTNIYLRNGTVNPARLHKGFGPPSAESDNAWDELLQHQDIRLQREELGEFQDLPDLVEFSDGSGYYATLSAYHSLHCIKYIHHALYFDYYYPGVTGQDKILSMHHTEHCLNILLQTVQCNADLSIIPMEWGATTRVPIGLDQGHHQCTSWEEIEKWMSARSVDVFEEGLVVHPVLGDAYPDKHGDKIGIVLDDLLGSAGGQDGRDEHQ